MSWLFFAILARFLWACTNIFDQYMVRYVQKKSPLVAITIEHLVVIPVTVILLAAGFRLPANSATVAWLLFGAFINVSSLLPYFLALKHDEAHNAAPLMELTPVFLTLLAWVVFGDALTPMQLLGAGLVIASGFLFSWDFKGGRLRLRTALLMAACSLCWAVYQLLLRANAAHERALDILLTVGCGYVAISMALYIAWPRLRKLVIQSVRKSKGIILAAAFVEELVALGANFSLVSAFARAPRTGQVAALSAVQPIFVMLISIALGFLLPKYCPRLAWDWEMKIKCLLLAVIAGGVMLLKAP